MPVVAAMALVGGFATFHGWAHGAEMPADAGALTYALGFVAATALLHAAGIAGAMGVAAAGRQVRQAGRADRRRRCSRWAASACWLAGSDSR